MCGYEPPRLKINLLKAQFYFCSCPPIFGNFCSNAPPSALSLFIISTYTPNNFLPDTSLISPIFGAKRQQMAELLTPKKLLWEREIGHTFSTLGT